ncbi:class I glutamine amidotransferase-like protein [Westerdykella ornata]|uniref:Class I glutamine amidotransferase-like protein n=1 Tax=Westerdykella ornata TaxID=318751 RepID=A0A6A6JLS4_WESOR|nr:class I glutamine amidotransferase-like protein [Westerdykella ornata]KAF2276606.1 class I glutamine amidotransferase-like protein [Westerdykella ornata]
MRPFRIGVLIVPPIQFLDAGPVDLFAMLSQSYFEGARQPPALVAQAIPDKDLHITWISHNGANSTSPTSAGVRFLIDAGLDDPRVAPGSLDLLFIPGPPPGLRPPESVLQFVRDHVAKGTELFTVCSGVFVAGYAGVLDGKRATGTRGVMDILQTEFPKVHWVDKRYTNDGKIYTSGGITNGMDAAGVYLRRKFPKLADTVLTLADVDVRGPEYHS